MKKYCALFLLLMCLLLVSCQDVKQNIVGNISSDVDKVSSITQADITDFYQAHQSLLNELAKYVLETEEKKMNVYYKYDTKTPCSSCRIKPEMSDSIIKFYEITSPFKTATQEVKVNIKKREKKVLFNFIFVTQTKDGVPYAMEQSLVFSLYKVDRERYLPVDENWYYHWSTTA